MTTVRLTGGGYAAGVDLHGGGLCELRHRGRAVIASSQPGDHPAAWEGRVLAPWPNRIADGSYEFAGRSLDVAVNEPSRGNALHGLVWALMWEVTERSTSQTRIATVLDPSAGYPWCLDLAIVYTVDSAGLTMAMSATNRSDDVAPFGCGLHPYLLAPGGTLDACALSLAARERLDVSADRLLPAGRRPVHSTAFDFVHARPIGDTIFDHAFTGLERDADGHAAARISTASGRHVVECWWDNAFEWVQLYTPGPAQPNEPRSRIAVEPMTCPADAFNSGTDLVRLEPGERWFGTIGIRTSSL